MPLFRKESKKSPSTSSNSPTPHSSPTLKNESNHSNVTTLNLHPINSSNSTISTNHLTHDQSDDHKNRSHRSTSVSQKFKSFFGGSSSDISNLHQSEESPDDLKRVKSSSSLLNRNNMASHRDRSSTVSNGSIDNTNDTLYMNTNNPSLNHPTVLPIPNRTMGRPLPNTHSLHINTQINQSNNLDSSTGPKSKASTPVVRTPISQLNKLSLQPTPVINDIDSELDIPVDQVPKFVSLDHSKSSRIRSSTVSAAFLNPLGHNNSNSKFGGIKHNQNNLSNNDLPKRTNDRKNDDIAAPIQSFTGSQYNSASSLKDPRRLQGLKHTESVNISATHLKHQREQVIKLSNRIAVSEFGRFHEHDYSKYKTHPNKPTVNLFSWMKKKDSNKGEKENSDSSYEIIEKSISLLPDKYSGNLMKVKNNPKNYIWNYDDDDDDDDDDNDDDDDDDDNSYDTDDDSIRQSPSSDKPKIKRKNSHQSNYSSNYARSNKSVRSRQSRRMTMHYNSDDEYENVNDYVKDVEANDDDSDHIVDRKSKDYTNNRYDDYDEEEDDTEGDSDDDDDFDDEVDNMMIEPIIGKEQVFLINSMLSKIEHPDKFRARIEEKEKDGKVKLTLAQKYGHIEGVVGKGSYGTVCISSKVVNNTKIYFAIKQIKRKQGESIHHFGNRVTSEFMISSSLTHQAVINVYDLMVDPISNTYSEIMEFIPCGDLFSLISVTNGLTIVECDCFFKQILNAITYLHSVGVSHNDLKVENLLLTRKGQLKIIDFGTSAVFKTAWENDVQLSLGACGSERYVAPEQYNKDKEYDPRLGDVWSLGIIYLTMYYGKYSWESAKLSDESYAKFIDTRANYDYSRKSATKAHQFFCVKSGSFSTIENIKGGILSSWVQKGGQLDSNVRNNDEELVNDSRRYVLYNILNPNPTFRMRTYQIWQSEWIKNFHVCDAGRGYVSYDNYIEMALKSAQDLESREKEKEKDKEGEKDNLERKESSKKLHGFLGLGSKN